MDLFTAIVPAAVGAAAINVILWLRSSPRPFFRGKDSLSVSWGSTKVRCNYWVEWGDNRWHVSVSEVIGNPKDPRLTDEYVRGLVAYALRGKERTILIGGAEVAPSAVCPEKIEGNA